MGFQAAFNCSVIAIGAMVMLVSIVQSNQFSKLTRAIMAEHRQRIDLYLTLHRGLMIFFLLGYVGSIAAIIMKYPLLSESFVSFIFLFGSVFVYLCVAVQLLLLKELRAGASQRK
jgi:hypothetical protein